MNSCDGYNSTSSSISNCTSVGSCQKGSSTFYKCNQCKYNYSVNNDGQCQQIESCPRGYIYYSDGTCSDEYNSSKTVIGVVSGSGVIVNTTNSEERSYDAAVSRCSGITRGGKTARLPTYDELYGMNGTDSWGVTYVNRINEGLEKIPGAVKIDNDYLWTSTPYDSYHMWQVNPTRGGMQGVEKDFFYGNCSDTLCVFDH